MATDLGYFGDSLVPFAKSQEEMRETARQIVTLLNGMPIGQALRTLDKVEHLLGAGHCVDVASPKYQEALKASKDPDFNF